MFNLTSKSKSSKLVCSFPYEVVEKSITSFTPGQVKSKKAYWRALIDDSKTEQIRPGEVIEVIGQKGSSLLVMPFRAPAQ